MMFRRAFSRRIAVILGIAAVAAMAAVGCSGGEGSDGTAEPVGSEQAECDLNDQECVQRVATELVENADCDLNNQECVDRVAIELGEKIGCELTDPDCVSRVAIELGKTRGMPDSFSVALLTTPEPTPSPEQVARMGQILYGNETIKAMLAGREDGRDYWIRVSYVYEHRGIRNYGEKPIAMVHIYFDPPLSFAGEVPVITKDPCRGHGDEGYLDPNDPCVDEPKEYGTEYQTFTGVQGVVAQVDLPRGEVVQIFAAPVTPEELTDIRSQYGQ